MAAGTGEIIDLVSWNSPEHQGKIPGSDWVCPVGDLRELANAEMAGVSITDAVVQELLPESRAQHLELTRYPEGYLEVKIADSEGRELTDARSQYQYGGLGGCTCGGNRESPTVTSVLWDRPIDLGDGKEIWSVRRDDDGLRTSIRPTQVPSAAMDHEARFRTGSDISPQGRHLAVRTEGSIRAIDQGHAQVVVLQNGAKRGGRITTWISGHNANHGAVEVGLGPTGQVRTLKVCRDGLLKAIGANVTVDLRESDGWGEVTDPRKQSVVVDAMAEALGLEGGWRGLDLKLTASGLYTAMGRRNFDPTSALVPLD